MRVELTNEQYSLITNLVSKEAERLRKLRGTYKTEESINKLKDSESAIWDLRFTLYECKQELKN